MILAIKHELMALKTLVETIFACTHTGINQEISSSSDVACSAER
jgi:hypothetical protein